MTDYKKLVEKALTQKKRVSLINEGILYPENMQERMHPKLEEELGLQKTSLGKHPVFPDGDENSFEQKIMGERFADVCKRYKRAFDVDAINSKDVPKQLMGLVYETMSLESAHKKELEELAVRMVREEYDMSEDVVEIVAELTPDITLEGTQMNPTPIRVEEMEFDSHDDIANANDEVYKRRFLNAMTQGAAKKVNHMFHMVDEELVEMDPRLPNKYSKMMSAADYAYYMIHELKDTKDAKTGGVVKVDFPSKKNPKAKITAQAMVFPVLIHEIVKGVMELLSANGLPKNKKLAEFVCSKADFTAAEPWDMRIGPALWERFAGMVGAEDFNLKHHVYAEMAKLPAGEFHRQMKEVLAKTKQGKKIITDILDRVKQELQQEEYDKALNELGIGDDMEEFDEGIDPFL